MRSLIPGYEYDIFISYRQKDNKHDGWVTKFVENLNGELEATFKEEISIYFDENPHDGLQETNDVEKSLEGKLKCLIFIPILSQTYCDPASYAWQYEFLAFNKFASEDHFGRNIRLRNGNYAGRILPIMIHDLEPEDVKLFEKETGSVLRPLDFVFKTAAGVNRPLRVNEDHPHDNLNRTYYNDQINKVAGAIKEIILSMKKEPVSSIRSDTERIQDKIPGIKENGQEIRGQKSKKLFLVLLSFIIFIFGAIAVVAITENSKKKNDIARLEKSIAVLPFVNDSPDKENEYFCNGMMDEILNNLQKIKDFRVLSRTSVEQFRGSNKPGIPKIAKVLEVNYIVEGSVQKYGNTFRLRIQLIAVHNEKHLWGETYEQEIKNTEDIFKIQSIVAQSIADELRVSITPEERTLIQSPQSVSLTAHDFLLQAGNEHLKFMMDYENVASLNNAISLYRRAIASDPAYSQAYSGLAIGFYNKYHFQNDPEADYPDSIKIYSEKALRFNNKLDEAHLTKGIYYDLNGEWDKSLEEYSEAIKINPNYSLAYLNRAMIYALKIHEVYESFSDNFKAISLERGPLLPHMMRGLGVYFGNMGFPERGRYFVEEALKLDNDSGRYFKFLSDIESAQNNFEVSLDLAGQALNIDPENLEILFNIMIFNNMLGRNEDAYAYALQILNLLKDYGLSPNSGWENIGYAFWNAGHKNEAEYYFKKQIDLYDGILRLDPNDPNASTFLAGIYSFKGDVKKALQTLPLDKWFSDLQNQKPHQVASLSYFNELKFKPQYENLRKQPSFLEYLNKYEEVYRKEHDAFEKWLKEKGMI